jgi:hypothetical protein
VRTEVNVSKPMWAKVDHLTSMGLGARAEGDTLYVWSWVPRTWSTGRVRCLVLFNNPSFRTIREKLSGAGFVLTRQA